MGKTKWGDGEGRRRDIRSAAATILERDGYAALNMRAVADAAGVSPGTVYTYFASKEDLFAALYAERIARLRAELAPELAAADTLEDALLVLAARYLDVYRVFGRDLNVWASTPDALASGSATALLAVSRTTLADIRAALERIEPRLTTSPDSELIVPLVWSSLTGLAFQLTSTRWLVVRFREERLTELWARALAAGIRDRLA